MSNDPRDMIAKGFAGFTLKRTLWLIACILIAVSFFALGLALTSEEELFLAPWWMRVAQVIFIVCAVLIAVPVTKQLPWTVSKVSGKLTEASALPYLVLVFGIFMSHPLIWGALHHFHPGSDATLRGTVLASGRRHGRATGGHGDWMDVQLDGKTSKTRIETDELYPIHSDDAGRTFYCALEDTKPGDTVDLIGKRSLWGFAVMKILPTNARLMDACDTSAPQPR